MIYSIINMITYSINKKYQIISNNANKINYIYLFTS